MIDVSNIKPITAKDRIVDAVKQLELSILKYIDRICRKNGIEYSICGGTMLGAIRHGGFIPWDDDIDINFTEEEYFKFIHACEKDLDTEKFMLLTTSAAEKAHYFSGGMKGGFFLLSVYVFDIIYT